MEQWSGRRLVINLFLILLSVAVVIAVFAPVFDHDRRKKNAHGFACLNNLKHIGVAIDMYLADNAGNYPSLSTLDQRAPDRKAWPDKISHYLKIPKRRFRCHMVEDRLTYSYNRRVSGLSEKDIADKADLVLVFDTVSDSKSNNNLNGDTVWISSDGGLPKPGQFAVCTREWKKPLWGYPKWAIPNHIDAANVLYADNHVRAVTAETLPNFEPKKARR